MALLRLPTRRLKFPDTRGNLSDTTSGFKALVLKAIAPVFFKKRGRTRIVSFQITGG